MVGWLSHLWWGGDPDTVHPVSGLTRREVHAVQKSWAPINAKPFANGAELFRRLFTRYPETRELFFFVRNLPEEKYMTSPQFTAHVIYLMTSLDLAIKNLNNPEVAAALMTKLGTAHGKRHITEAHFMCFKDLLVQMLTEDLQLNTFTLSSWAKTVDFFYKSLLEALAAANS